MSNELWCVYIEGPDDIVAMPSKDAAETVARKLTEAFADSKAKYGVTIKASAMLYESDANDHKRNLDESFADYAHLLEEPKA